MGLTCIFLIIMVLGSIQVLTGIRLSSQKNQQFKLLSHLLIKVFVVVVVSEWWRFIYTDIKPLLRHVISKYLLLFFVILLFGGVMFCSVSTFLCCWYISYFYHFCGLARNSLREGRLILARSLGIHCIAGSRGRPGWMCIVDMSTAKDIIASDLCKWQNLLLVCVRMLTCV